ncbi:helix-turn-helix domain-containing protein [Weissella minor]|uniref:helix-turn-helix domain-containing protein n=1 Tax=Weissella minor TaxID=1620 RepID=UPI003AF2ADBD
MTTFVNIKKTAQERGLNLKTVATKAGLSENAIYSWRNKNPRTESLQSVADVLGVSVDYLLGNSDEMHTQSNLVSDADLESAFDGAESFDGKPLTEQDKRIMKNLLISYMESKE